MRVYRVEYTDGQGPYQNHARSEHVKDKLMLMVRFHTDDWRYHPAIHRHVHMLPGMYCGFDSMQQLATWFKGYLGILHELGFMIVVYELGDKYVVYKDKFQLAFVKEKAKFVRVESLISFND